MGATKRLGDLKSSWNATARPGLQPDPICCGGNFATGGAGEAQGSEPA
jgi:hypothetical protein